MGRIVIFIVVLFYTSDFPDTNVAYLKQDWVFKFIGSNRNFYCISFCSFKLLVKLNVCDTSINVKLSLMPSIWRKIMVLSSCEQQKYHLILWWLDISTQKWPISQILPSSSVNFTIEITTSVHFCYKSPALAISGVFKGF